MRRRMILLCGWMAFLSVALPFRVQADLIKASTTFTRTVLITASTDHITGLTGQAGSVVVKASKAGAAFAIVADTVTEVGNGRYAIALTTTDTNTLGALDLFVTATGGDPTDSHDQIVGFDPTSATNLGLASLPTIAPTSPGGLLTSGTGLYQLNPSGGTLTSSSVTTVATGSAQAGGSTTTIILANTTAFATDIIKGDAVVLTGVVGTNAGAGQARTITGYNAGTFTATISRPWVTYPDATSTYAIIATPHAALDTNLAVSLGTADESAILRLYNGTNGASGNNTTPVFLSSILANAPTGAGLSGTQAQYLTDLHLMLDAAGLALGTPVYRLNAAALGLIAPTNFNLFAIDGTGKVALTTAEHTNIGTDVANFVIDPSGSPAIRVKDAVLLSFLNTMGKFGTPVRSGTSPWTITVPFLRMDGSTTAWSYTTTYIDNTFSKSTGRTFTAGTLLP